MRLNDYEIIKIHQTTKDFTKWYNQSIDSISKYISYNEAKKLVQYSLIKALNESIIRDTEELVANNKNARALYDSIFDSLGETAYMDSVNSYEENSETYQEFMGQYKLDRHAKIDDTGKFWLKLVDSMYESKENQRALLDDLIPFVRWISSYANEYAYQFLTANTYNIRYNYAIRSPYNYWELKEQEHTLDIYSNGKEADEYIYHNREELLYDLVNHGLFLPEAIKITHVVRMGRNLSENQKETLVNHGYDKMAELTSIRYLPSLANVFSKVFRVNRLI